MSENKTTYESLDGKIAPEALLKRHKRETSDGRWARDQTGGRL